MVSFQTSWTPEPEASLQIVMISINLKVDITLHQLFSYSQGEFGQL